jgi:hypothetical protein
MASMRLCPVRQPLHLFQRPAAQFDPVGHCRFLAAAARSFQSGIASVIGAVVSVPAWAAARFFVVARLPGGDGGQAPHVQKAAQLLVTGGVVSGIDCLVVLAEELIAFWLGEVSQDHLRICGVFRRPGGHEP